MQLAKCLTAMADMVDNSKFDIPPPENDTSSIGYTTDLHLEHTSCLSPSTRQSVISPEKTCVMEKAHMHLLEPDASSEGTLSANIGNTGYCDELTRAQPRNASKDVDKLCTCNEGNQGSHQGLYTADQTDGSKSPEQLKACEAQYFDRETPGEKLNVKEDAIDGTKNVADANAHQRHATDWKTSKAQLNKKYVGEIDEVSHKEQPHGEKSTLSSLDHDSCIADSLLSLVASNIASQKIFRFAFAFLTLTPTEISNAGGILFPTAYETIAGGFYWWTTSNSRHTVGNLQKKLKRAVEKNIVEKEMLEILQNCDDNAQLIQEQLDPIIVCFTPASWNRFSSEYLKLPRSYSVFQRVDEAEYLHRQSLGVLRLWRDKPPQKKVIDLLTVLYRAHIEGVLYRDVLHIVDPNFVASVTTADSLYQDDVVSNPAPSKTNSYTVIVDDYRTLGYTGTLDYRKNVCRPIDEPDGSVEAHGTMTDTSIVIGQQANQNNTSRVQHPARFASCNTGKNIFGLPEESLMDKMARVDLKSHKLDSDPQGFLSDCNSTLDYEKGHHSTEKPYTNSSEDINLGQNIRRINETDGAFETTQDNERAHTEQKHNNEAQLERDSTRTSLGRGAGIPNVNLRTGTACASISSTHHATVQCDSSLEPARHPRLQADQQPEVQQLRSPPVHESLDTTASGPAPQQLKGVRVLAHISSDQLTSANIEEQKSPDYSKGESKKNSLSCLHGAQEASVSNSNTEIHLQAHNGIGCNQEQLVMQMSERPKQTQQLSKLTERNLEVTHSNDKAVVETKEKTGRESLRKKLNPFKQLEFLKRRSTAESS